MNGSLDTEKFLRAILVKGNTPDPIIKLSPAEIVFGRKLKDTLSRLNKNLNIFFTNSYSLQGETFGWKKRLPFAPLPGMPSTPCRTLQVPSKTCRIEGDRVMIQNQRGPKPTKLDRSGTIVEVRDFDKYIVKVDGSG